MATQLGRNARQYANRISALSKPSFSGRSAFSARFYCNSSISQTRAQHQLSAAQHQLSAAQLQVSAVAAAAPPVSDKTVTIVANVIAASFSVFILYGFFYQNFDITKPSEIRKRAEKRVMENFNRELNTFDAKLCKSGGDDEKLMMYEREFAALKEIVSARDEEAEKITKHAKVG